MSYKMFAMVVTCKKEDGRKTIVDQRDLDIGKAADQTENVCEELSTKIQSVSYSGSTGESESENASHFWSPKGGS